MAKTKTNHVAKVVKRVNENGDRVGVVVVFFAKKDGRITRITKRSKAWLRAQGLKYCPKCGTVKPLSGFGVHKTEADGLQHKCRECKHEYHEAHKDEVSEYNHQYHEANKDKINEQNLQYYEANKDKINEQRRQKCAEERKKLEAQGKLPGESNPEFFTRMELGEILPKQCTFDTQKTYPDLVGFGGGACRYDFEIHDESGAPVLFLEIDGEFHRRPIPTRGSCSGTCGFVRTVTNDRIKDAYAERLGVPVVRVPVYDDDTEESIRRRVAEALAKYFS